MPDPLISICIPAYKAEKYLEATLDSVRAQTFVDWELIVTEDGSKDRTEEIVQTFARSVSQPVTYNRHEKNRGLPTTRNTGIAAARAEWIALLDSDDLWTPGHLSLCKAIIERTRADFVHSGSILFDSDSGRELEARAPSYELRQDLPLSLFDSRYIIQPSSVVMHRAVWDRSGRFDPDFRYVEDRDMWLRCARAGAHIEYTGSNTCLYRKHGNALSTHSAPMAEAAARVFSKHLDWEAIPLDVRKRHCSRAWADAARLSWRDNPHIAAAHFKRACAVSWNLNWWSRSILCRLLAWRSSKSA